MAIVRLVRFSLFFGIMLGITAQAWAYKRESRVPLIGCGGYSAASGSAKSFEIRRVNKEVDREELVVEIKNVPLRPGTVLIVYVGDDDVGRITLDARQNGSLKLSSDVQKYVPLIEPGTSVTIKTYEGRLVMR